MENFIQQFAKVNGFEITEKLINKINRDKIGVPVGQGYYFDITKEEEKRLARGNKSGII